MNGIFIIKKKFKIEDYFLVKIILLLEITYLHYLRKAILFYLYIISTKIITSYVVILNKEFHLIRVFSKMIIYNILAIIDYKNLDLFFKKSSIS